MRRPHLSREDLLAVVEGRGLDLPHVRECAQCQLEVVALQQVLREVHALEVPEPSPLFWGHLSRRIGEAVADEARQPRSRFAWARWWAWAAPMTAAVALAVAFLAASPAGTRPPVTPAAALDASTDGELRALLEAADATPWSADDRWPLAASADSLVAQLSAEEEAVLIDLLRLELEGS
jgi:hypothetical protein